MSVNVGFDRDFTLGELITARDADEISKSLSQLLGSAVAVLDGTGATFGSVPPEDGAERVPLVLELDPVGYLVCHCSREMLAQAARTVRWGLLSRARFRMVSDLHLEAVRSDYAKLQQQNEALKASEAKYRELSEALDAKVKEQVKIIDERQRQLYQAERLASIGQLAAGVAHEINNPLGFINSNLSSATRYVEVFANLRGGVPSEIWRERDLNFVIEDFTELLRDSRAGVDRIASIVKDLKGFSSVDQPEAQLVDLTVQLASLAAVISGQKPEGVTVRTDFAPVPPLLCLPGHLNQAFLNVLQNALQAVNGNGTVTLSTREHGGKIIVQVIDDGVGIPDDVMPYIFDPFYTTRGVGGGTGLGLTVARDIILTHGAEILVRNGAPRGVIVSMEFPL